MMFAYLKGILKKKMADCIILEVAGVGYLVYTAPTPLYHQSELEKEVKVFTFLNVRDDRICLYGFFCEEELKMFEQLLTVSGVGPKAALSLVGSIPPTQFALAVLTDDADRLVKAPGIGKKTAQRIILELKDKLKKEYKDMSGPDGLMGIPAESGDEAKLSEAVSALIMLGYTSSEANRAVAAAYSKDKTVESIVRDALKAMLQQ
jgi:Holliday junction DNA helicase RuvA